MVTANSFNPDLNVTGSELWNSDFTEDKEIALAVEKTLKELIATLIPVIKYVDTEITPQFRGVVVANHEGAQLLLSRNGKWVRGLSDGRHEEDPAAWEKFVVSEIFEGLETAFTTAVEKKTKHLAAVEARRELLTKVGALARGDK
ncbi:MAG: hypothetical protein ABIS26_02680 [Candidatus Paceibacterota bacterium]